MPSATLVDLDCLGIARPFLNTTIQSHWHSAFAPTKALHWDYSILPKYANFGRSNFQHLNTSATAFDPFGLQLSYCWEIHAAVLVGRISKLLA